MSIKVEAKPAAFILGKKDWALWSFQITDALESGIKTKYVNVSGRGAPGSKTTTYELELEYNCKPYGIVPSYHLKLILCHSYCNCQNPTDIRSDRIQCWKLDKEIYRAISPIIWYNIWVILWKLRIVELSSRETSQDRKEALITGGMKMQKKFLAVVLSGMMVLGSFVVVYAADEQESEIAVSVEAEEGGLGSLLGGLSVNTDTLKSLASGLGSKLGIDLSGEDIASLSGMLKNPETLNQTLGGLFTEGGIGAKVLDVIGSRSSMLAAVVDSVKNGEGGYDMDKMIESLENAVEKDGSVVIGGTEISKEEISAVVTDVLALFGGSQ